MARKIYCASCNKYLGEIEKARLRKDTIYLCGTCENARKLMFEVKKAKGNNPFNNIFGDTFK